MSQRFIRFYEFLGSEPQYGIIENDSVLPLKIAPWLSDERTGGSISMDELSGSKMLPTVEPSKIICIGLNYHAHIKASQSADKAPERPLLFMKPPSSLIGKDENIILPAVSKRVDYEAELGVVIGKTASNVNEQEANNYIFGLTCVNDVTARDLQKVDGQWTRAKGFDTFCPVGPWIVTDVDYDDILVEGVLNGKVMQSGRTSQMIFRIPYLISYISSIMTLNPGDLISTGTPSGISPMKAGDKMEVRIENVGSLINYVESDKN
ncbi:MAG: fumarylacetoacetate hydrolase family protein [candidate division Zixibacteria bacterium]|nr:fumarylacetoacetate hydrolase family protein [candidate division Zixibacteria bacterium]